jgi:hypothetical protein
MRQYMETEAGKKVFRRTYEEALSVALATALGWSVWPWTLFRPDGRAMPEQSNAITRGLKK